MTASVPPGLPPEPPAIVEQVKAMQEGLNGLAEPYRIADDMSRRTDDYPPQGTSQSR